MGEESGGGVIILFDPDDEASKAFAGAYYDDSQEPSFLGKKVITVKDEDKELANKTADLIKKSGFDKTLKELEKDD